MEGLGPRAAGQRKGTLMEKLWERYDRQVMIPEFGTQAQQRLLASSVLVVGAGGLGSPVLLYLAGAGIGRIGVVDGDSVALHNLHRQIIFGDSDLDQPKAVCAAREVQKRSPHCQVDLFATDITPSNAHMICSEYDLIIDGSDNFPTRYLINDVCVELGKPWISGAVLRFIGQVTTCNALNASGQRGPTYRCLFPEPPTPESAPGCAESGVLGIVPGVIGTLMAGEAIKLLSQVGETLSGRLLIFDALSPSFRVVSFDRDDQTVAQSRVLSAPEYARLCGVAAKPLQSIPPAGAIVHEISPRELSSRQRAGERLELIDIREVSERAISSIGGVSIPLSELEDRRVEIPKDRPVVLYCRSGERSRRACQKLSTVYGFTNLVSLAGGMLRWGVEINPASCILKKNE